MDLATFADLVGHMRASQRAFFRTRDQSALRESKDYERRVDAALEEIEGRKKPSLFDPDTKEPA